MMTITNSRRSFFFDEFRASRKRVKSENDTYARPLKQRRLINSGVDKTSFYHRELRYSKQETTTTIIKVINEHRTQQSLKNVINYVAKIEEVDGVKQIGKHASLMIDGKAVKDLDELEDFFDHVDTIIRGNLQEDNGHDSLGSYLGLRPEREKDFKPYKHIIFSYPASEKDLRRAMLYAFKNALKTYGYELDESSYLTAFHSDTAHPHVHLITHVFDKSGRRIFFDRDFILFMRKKFAQHLRMSGYSADANYHKEVHVDPEYWKISKIDDKGVLVRSMYGKFQRLDGEEYLDFVKKHYLLAGDKIKLNGKQFWRSDHSPVNTFKNYAKYHGHNFEKYFAGIERILRENKASKYKFATQHTRFRIFQLTARDFALDQVRSLEAYGEIGSLDDKMLRQLVSALTPYYGDYDGTDAETKKAAIVKQFMQKHSSENEKFKNERTRKQSESEERRTTSAQQGREGERRS